MDKCYRIVFTDNLCCGMQLCESLGSRETWTKRDIFVYAGNKNIQISNFVKGKEDGL